MRFEVIVIANTGFISDTARDAWQHAQIKLVGPVSPSDFKDDAARRCGGVLLDLELDSNVLFALSERLMRLSTPFLFVVNSRELAGTTQPFLLTEHEEDIRAIVDALAHDSSDDETANLH